MLLHRHFLSSSQRVQNMLCLLDRTSCLQLPKRYLQTEISAYLASIPFTHNQRDCERFWTDVWQRKGLFESKTAENGKNFRLLLPPPNITGNLHLGHALTVAIQDTLCRYYRMNGQNVTWYSGTDHAGIATQMVIEKLLWTKQGKTRHDVTREEFAQLFETWKQEKTRQIQAQLLATGASLDGSRASYFTLSPEMTENVNRAFIELFNRGLIYRGSYMVNWSYHLQSTLSDIEIELEHISKPTEYQAPGCDERFLLGVLHRFKYPIESEDSGEFIEIATTRIETLMGDVALCVHPDDTRHSHLIGRFAFNPFTQKRMPILADESVAPDFGTGVLKLTPAHSSIDYDIAQRHHLPLLNIWDDRGFLQSPYEPLNKIHRYAAKRRMVEDLNQRGLYCGFDEHKHAIRVCSRSGDLIESRLVPQWFLRSDDARYITEYLVNRDGLSEASRERWNRLREELPPEGRNIALIPSSFRNTWKDWFSRYKDWCISRQIFWGHQIPAYQVYKNGKATDSWVAAKSEKEALELAREKHQLSPEELTVKQDTDVLDTWFSSALLPLAVTGWFENRSPMEDGKPPLSLMETGHDIIFFWVGRMVLLSTLLANQIPFDRVLLHGMICDASGKKMSKSKGNVVDPMHVINGAKLEDLLIPLQESATSGIISEKLFKDLFTQTHRRWPNGMPVCGADILRLSLLQSGFKEFHVRFSIEAALDKRVFANKMHQTTRFILKQFEMDIAPFRRIQFEPNQMRPLERWIATKLTRLTKVCETAFVSYDLHLAARAIEHFWTHDFCQEYLESTKPFMYWEQQSDPDRYLLTLNIFIELLKRTLRLIHPFMPFITENLYQMLEHEMCKRLGEEYQFRSIMQAGPYPSAQNDELLRHFDHSYMEDFEAVIRLSGRIRWFRSNFRVFSEPLIQELRVASMNPNLAEHEAALRSTVKNPDCRIEFVSLHDIYRYDDCYCFKVNLNEEESDKRRNETSSSSSSSSSSDSEAEQSKPKHQPANSLKSNEIYLLFTVDREKIKQRLLDPRFGSMKPEKVDALMAELDQYHATRFTENFKRITRIVG